MVNDWLYVSPARTFPKFTDVGEYASEAGLTTVTSKEAVVEPFPFEIVTV
jgi:hypothetical protein